MIWRKKRFLLEGKKWWDAVFATFPILVQYRGRIYVTLQSFPLPQYSTLKDFFLRIRRRTQQNQRYEGESKWKTQKYRKLGNFSLARIFFVHLILNSVSDSNQSHVRLCVFYWWYDVLCRTTSDYLLDGWKVHKLWAK